MGTPWDRAADRYLEQWVPRFVPYHLDLVNELALSAGQRVLVTSAGPGAEALAVARAVGEAGVVRATDENADMIRFCSDQAKKASFGCISCERAPLDDVGEGGWHAIICAFGLWRIDERRPVLEKWAHALTAAGKVGVLTFGPPEDSDPFEILSSSLRDLEPDALAKPPRIEASREAMARMFEEGGLVLVRHTVLRHTVSFPSAEEFLGAIAEGRTWRRVWDELGEERVARVAARFFDRVGGPTAPLVFEPAVTLAIAALPGAEVELAHRPSVHVPTLSSIPPPSTRAPAQGEDK